MGYSFISNITSFSTSEDIYETIPIDGEITFQKGNVNVYAKFITIRAHEDNNIVVQILPYKNGAYISAGEVWSIESLEGATGIKLKYSESSGSEKTKLSSGKIHWIAGY